MRAKKHFDIEYPCKQHVPLHDKKINCISNIFPSELLNRTLNATAQMEEDILYLSNKIVLYYDSYTNDLR